MRDAETATLKRLLAHVGANHSRLPRVPLTGFLAMVGRQYRGELMVVGRAVNGWLEGWLPSEVLDPIRVAEVTDQTLASVTDHNGYPMLWVSERWGSTYGYNSRKSAFWRVIRGVVGRMGIADTETLGWPSVLAWSNLYKLGPAWGGNPSTALSSIQRGHSRNSSPPKSGL